MECQEVTVTRYELESRASSSLHSGSHLEFAALERFRRVAVHLKPLIGFVVSSWIDHKLVEANISGRI